MIPYSRQTVTAEDIDAVVEVLQSDFLTQGPVLRRFEESVAYYCQARHAVATSSATAALHVACLSLEIGKGDLVWVSAISFVASANCARYVGAQVDFVDINATNGLIDIAELEKKLLLAKAKNRLPRALVVVHLAGQSCAMEEISALCSRYKVSIIEDASHAFGASYRGHPVGSCIYSDVAIFSFHPVKPITSGEGGVVCCNNAELVRKMRLFASHGIERDEERFNSSALGEWYYEQQLLGYNYRLSDIHAALGLSQMNDLDEAVSQRNSIAKQYDALFYGTAVKPLTQGDSVLSSYHLYIVTFPSKEIRNHAFTSLREQGFGVNLHYMPIAIQPYYQSQGARIEDIPNAILYSEIALSLPLYRSMDRSVPEQVAAICLNCLDGDNM